MEGLAIVLAMAAFLAGVTGTWSPCGFSMIETIGPRGHLGGRSTTIAACATFAIGAVVGGLITFGGLAWLGSLLPGEGTEAAYLVAAGIAAAAALLEMRGTPILPQVRRQLPEHWRRLMPMPLAAGLYGVLLGLGFTTFVLTFGVFALAGIAFAVGDPQVGLVTGLAFGVGRALPVVIAAPIADRDAGVAITEAMASRPSIYRGFRLGDGITLLAAAAALVVAAPVGASKTAARPAADPGTGAGAFVYQRPDRTGVLQKGDRRTVLPGHDPAIGDGRVAVIRRDQIVILSAQDLHEVGRVRARGADAVAISGSWLAWRVRIEGRDLIRARNVRDPARPGPEHSLAGAGRRSQLGRPSLDDNRLVYARASEKENLIVKRVLGGDRAKGSKQVLMRSSILGLSNPSLRGDDLLYVRNTAHGDQLRLAAAGGGGPGKVLISTRQTLWSTALSKKRAYVTVISGTAPRQRIVSVVR
jgi:hypothetical protein